MARRREPAVAASSDWVDEDGIRQPRGDVHAWTPGTNQTLCGVPLHRARLDRFQHVPWVDALWLSDTTEHGIALCHRCTAAPLRRGPEGASSVDPHRSPPLIVGPESPADQVVGQV